jgi:hypothetical protein
MKHPRHRSPSTGAGGNQSEPSGDEIRVRVDRAPPKRRRVAENQPQPAAYINLGHKDVASSAPLQHLLEALSSKKKILVVAGAGISVSAGSKSVSWVPWRLVSPAD